MKHVHTCARIRTPPHTIPPPPPHTPPTHTHTFCVLSRTPTESVQSATSVNNPPVFWGASLDTRSFAGTLLQACGNLPGTCGNLPGSPITPHNLRGPNRTRLMGARKGGNCVCVCVCVCVCLCVCVSLCVSVRYVPVTPSKKINKNYPLSVHFASV